MDDLDRTYLIDLWTSKLTATNPHSEGYYAGRIDEYAAQNAVDQNDVSITRGLAVQRLGGPEQD